MKTKHILLVLTAVSILSSNAFSAKWDTGAKPSRKITYKKVGDIELKLHVFDPAAKPAKPMGAIVFFFGGGWSGGSPSQFYNHSKYLASHGVLAISAEYRTKKNGGVEPSECVKDGKAAIRYVRKHAKELGVDPNRIAAGGGSAGGHVAAATGTVKGFEHKDEDMSISSRPNAMVLFNPVYDNSPNGYGNSRVKAYWKEFSPLHNIDKDTPPAIVFFGSNEKLVKQSAMKEFQAKMKALKIKSELTIYEGPGHGFFNYGRDGNKWFLATVTESHNFLKALGWLTGEPTVEAYIGKKPSSPAAAAGQRVSLFDGKTLAGWDVLTCKAEVSEGDILITAGNGLVQTKKMYKDFILEFDWKKLDEKFWDSGVYFRYTSVPKNRPWPGRYQANLRKDMEGNVGGIKGATSKGMIKPAEWNKFKLTLKGADIQLEINGKLAWKATGLQSLDKGYISLQAEVPGGGKHRFRNIFITELE
jgi:acetyl esterase/lipase